MKCIGSLIAIRAGADYGSFGSDTTGSVVCNDDAGESASKHQYDDSNESNDERQTEASNMKTGYYMRGLYGKNTNARIFKETQV
jgi:hypothetical protein